MSNVIEQHRGVVDTYRHDAELRLDSDWITAGREKLGFLASDKSLLAVIDAKDNHTFQSHSDGVFSMSSVIYSNEFSAMLAKESKRVTDEAGWGEYSDEGDVIISRAWGEALMWREFEGIRPLRSTNHFPEAWERIVMWSEILTAVVTTSGLRAYVEAGFTDVSTMREFLAAGIDPQLALTLQ